MMDATFELSSVFNSATYHFFATIYLLLSLISFVLNSIVLMTFALKHSLLTPVNLLVISIAASDWLMGVVANPMGFAANLPEAWALGKSTCVFYAFMTTFLSLGTMLHHMAFAIERYISLCCPLKMNLTTDRMRIVIGSLWFFSLSWSLCPLLGWSAYVPEGGHMACSIRWQSSRPTDTSYIICLFVFFYFGPIAVVVGCYGLVLTKVKYMTTRATRIWGPNAAATLETVLASWKLARIEILMVTGFLFAWTPYAIVSLYAAFGSSKNIPTMSTALPALFAKTSTMYNPLIYFFTYRSFRQGLIKILQPYRNRNAVQPIRNSATLAFVVTPGTSDAKIHLPSYRMHRKIAWN